ncbi:hypothetical protein HOD61_02230 [archaeon]|jgi:hypothetical protein|nr:hypothetical protein [archaeon]
MVVKKILIIILLIILVLASFGIKVYIDVMDDKKDAELFFSTETMNRELMDELNLICQEKDYFTPLCVTAQLALDAQNGIQIIIEDCETINFVSLPYYAFFLEEMAIENINKIRDQCTEKVLEYELRLSKLGDI